MQPTVLFGEAKWLTPGKNIDAPYIRGEFHTNKPISAAWLTICGLGFHEVYLNGKRVGDDRFGTLASDFHAYDEQPCYKLFGEVTAHRIYARTLYLDNIDTDNCIGIALAPGWYHNSGVYGFSTNYGVLKVCFRIKVTYDDNTSEEYLSGDWLKWTESPMTSYHFHYGENYDYNTYRLDGWNTVGYDDSRWKALTEVEAPDTDYQLSDCPPDRIMRYISPKLIAETDTGFLYDMGENITGTPILRQRVRGQSEKLTLRVSERLNPDCTIEDYTNHNQHCEFITDGSDREYKLRFMWYGFRYAEVSKNAEIVTCAVIHADVDVTSGFQSDNPLLNWLYDAYLRTQLDNMHCGIPSDCPHIEKRGYTGDGELVCDAAMTMLDGKRFYKKWLGDISDCQDRISGHVQYTAPYIRSGGGPGGWGCAIVEVPYQYYKHYGDKSVLAEFLPKTLRYFDYLEAHSENDLIVSDQKGEWCLGDWCTPEDIKIAVPFVNNYFYVKSINRLLEYCDILMANGIAETDGISLAELVPALKKRAEVKKAALVREYFDEKTGDFCGNIQGADAFAVDLGLGDRRTYENIVAHYRKDLWFDTGIFGTDIVPRVLFERGDGQLAYDLLTNKGKYSFWHWMSTGCTTLPEYWTYKRSQNHPMFGAATRYIFTKLLGIDQVGAGYKNIVIEPCFVSGLNYADGYVTTENGKVAVSYTKADGEISLRVTIPAGVTAILKAFGKEYHLGTGKNEFILK